MQTVKKIAKVAAIETLKLIYFMSYDARPSFCLSNPNYPLAQYVTVALITLFFSEFTPTAFLFLKSF